jgi:hypothetical protein
VTLRGLPGAVRLLGGVVLLLLLAAGLLQGRRAAQARFVHAVEDEALALLGQARADTRVVAAGELRDLPAPVKAWLEASGVVGRPRAATVRLRQRGELRARPGMPWMPVRAEQYFSVDPPGFVWRADATMMHVLPVAARDRYADGRGQMLIKAASVINVVDAADDKIDLGAMLRYLGETIWFPSAALEPYISWDAIDATHARATMRYAGRTVAAVLTFDGRGRVARFDARRYLGGGPAATLTPWFAVCSEWRRFDGVEIPTRGEVGWELPGGRFTYFRWEITDAQLNHADLYAEGASP